MTAAPRWKSRRYIEKTRNEKSSGAKVEWRIGVAVVTFFSEELLYEYLISVAEGMRMLVANGKVTKVDAGRCVAHHTRNTEMPACSGGDTG